MSSYHPTFPLSSIIIIFLIFVGIFSAIFFSVDARDPAKTAVLYVTTDGESWNAVPSPDDVTITALLPLSRERRLVYVGTLSHGLWTLTDNARFSEYQSRRGLITNEDTVIALAEIADGSGSMYAGIGRDGNTSLVRLGKDEKEIYVAPPRGRAIVEVITNHQNSQMLVLGFSDGIVALSEDAGESWRMLGDIGGSVNRLEFLSGSPLRLVARTKEGLLMRWDESGGWKDLLPSGLPALGYHERKAFDVVAAGATLYAITESDLLRSTDAGDTWTAVSTIIPKELLPATAVVASSDGAIAVSADGYFFLTKNAGRSWAQQRFADDSSIARLVSHPFLIHTFYAAITR